MFLCRGVTHNTERRNREFILFFIFGPNKSSYICSNRNILDNGRAHNS